MPVLNTISELNDCELQGRVRDYSWRKVTSFTTAQGLWFDMSMSPGNPPPKYWFDASPLVAKAVYQSTDGGIFHGANVSPSVKFLRRITAYSASATPLPVKINFLDYLLYYPSIDEGATDVQVLDNTVTLPRYTSGKGVMILPVTVGTRTAGAQFYVTYTNDEGVSGRVSQTVTLNTGVVGTVAASSVNVQNGSNPFIGLQLGDSGVRSIDNIQMLSATDGLFSLILVKPLCTGLIKEVTAPVELDYYLHKSELPIIEDNAYVSFLILPNGSLSGVAIIGDMKCIWSS